MDTGTASGLVQTLRKSAKLSIEDCAQRMGISPEELLQIEAGERDPTSEQMEQLALAYGLPAGTGHDFYTVLAMKEEDVPEEKREMYRKLMPTIRSILQATFLT